MRRRKSWFFPVVCFLLLLAGCGDDSNTGAGGGGGGSGGGLSSPRIVQVSEGAEATGIDIEVVAPHSNPHLNAGFLGVNFSQGGAAVTGDVVSRGQGTATVTMYGPGLSDNLTVSLTGPGDITIGSLTAIMSQDGTPGVQFPITLTDSTALGARTVILRAPNDDVTLFTGGLEVVP